MLTTAPMAWIQAVERKAECSGVRVASLGLSNRWLRTVSMGLRRVFPPNRRAGALLFVAGDRVMPIRVFRRPSWAAPRWCLDGKSTRS